MLSCSGTTGREAVRHISTKEYNIIYIYIIRILCVWTCLVVKRQSKFKLRLHGWVGVCYAGELGLRQGREKHPQPREQKHEKTGINLVKKKFEEGSNKWGYGLIRENKVIIIHVFYEVASLIQLWKLSCQWLLFIPTCLSLQNDFFSDTMQPSANSVNFQSFSFIKCNLYIILLLLKHLS